MVDASAAYLDAARRQFGERGHADRMRAVLGDFAALAEKPDPADIVTLDRVVCCYPDGEGLLARAATCAGTALAVSYPQSRWYVRAVTGLENVWRRMTGSAFRVFVHPPARLASALEASGLRRVSRRGTLVWVVELYRR
jgi:magnesium-protoporphyrin O-methyltransferase